VSGIKAPNGLLLLEEDGQLVLADVSREGLAVRGRTAVASGTAWTVPTVAGRRAYIRDRRIIKAIEL
jgi:hypothetical protein